MQQEALLDFENELLPLTSKVVEALKDSLDFYTLAALKVADNSVRINNQRFIEVKNINSVWHGLGGSAQSENS
ncbi:hypothetical protein AN214_01380 [Pseudoalteromonas sp. P1-9]|nr:hypothetical protein AN214_01380 [Pseudoalteromonas sp. P1-9]